ncbi:hypothetical protein [Nocardia huaxiensis]|uniref:Rv1733c family protein n=1 Tax=Nocardia huaxiensis TaxID=2755382 RepID=UPI001E53B4AC|nr:hypothetical protein [Nocardia huaxiensis]UFS97973.1 hypothetical protein LPY97_08790 [Nocardia huaxiensis]
MTRNPHLPLRLWRLGPWNSNPLMRGSDRCQTVIRLLVIALALLAVPLAGAGGTAAYAGSVERIKVDNAGKTAVTATLTAEPEPKGPFARYAPPRYEAPVRWERDGRTETATLVVDHTATAGSEVPLWIDEAGRPTSMPRLPSSAAWDGIGTAAAILMAVWVSAVAIDRSIDYLLTRRRGIRWEAELRELSRPIET